MEKPAFDYSGIANVHLVLAFFSSRLLALPTNLLLVAYWTGCLSPSPAHEEIRILLLGF